MVMSIYTGKVMRRLLRIAFAMLFFATAGAYAASTVDLYKDPG
jgi:hypothetical protein